MNSSQRPYVSGGLCFILLLCGLGFVISFFLPLFSNDSKLRDAELNYGYLATRFSWEYMFNSDGEPEQESMGRKLVAGVLLFGPGGNNQVDWDSEARKLMIHIYDFCLRTAWLCNAIPILVILVISTRNLTTRRLLLLAAWLLVLVSWSFTGLTLLASQALPPYESAYWVWASSLLLLTIFASCTGVQRESKPQPAAT